MGDGRFILWLDTVQESNQLIGIFKTRNGAEKGAQESREVDRRNGFAGQTTYRVTREHYRDE
jgi:hypothetical protein